MKLQVEHPGCTPKNCCCQVRLSLEINWSDIRYLMKGESLFSQVTVDNSEWNIEMYFVPEEHVKFNDDEDF